MNRQQLPHRPKSQGAASNTKRGFVGNTAGTVPPAWRSSAAQQRPGFHNESIHAAIGPERRQFRKGGPGGTAGSKIFMSQLPADDSIQEPDIEELFRETIGPVFDVFLLYNSQGRSKGMAVVNFQRSGDAAEARRKYNGKIIDGRRPLKIELITDPPEGSPLQPPTERSLAQRLGSPLTTNTAKPNTRPSKTPKGSVPMTGTKAQTQPQQQHGIKRRNMKKGPRRLKKSVEQLDREMEAYRAQAPHFSASNVGAAVGLGINDNIMQE